MPSKAQINQIIKKIDKKLAGIIEEDLAILTKIKKYVIQSGGKRIRPLTHYFFAKIQNYDGEKWLDVGAIAELIHAASLLHDDVVDNAFTRRGKPTVGQLYGNKTAILTGDYLLACGIKHLNQLQEPEILSVFTRVIRDLSVAELLQMQWERDPKISRTEYERIIYGKTASLFGSLCETVGLLSKQNQATIDELRAFGNSMGRLFQVRDDYIDYFTEEEDSGKEPYKDFQNGLYTYPIIVLREQCTRAEKKQIQSILAKDKKIIRDKKEIDGLFEKYSIAILIQQEICEEIRNLIKFLQTYPSSEYRELMAERLNTLLV